MLGRKFLHSIPLTSMGYRLYFMGSHGGCDQDSMLENLLLLLSPPPAFVYSNVQRDNTSEPAGLIIFLLPRIKRGETLGTRNS